MHHCSETYLDKSFVFSSGLQLLLFQLSQFMLELTQTHTASVNRRKTTSHRIRYLYLIIPVLCVWPARDWSKPPAASLQRHMRGRGHWTTTSYTATFVYSSLLHHCRCFRHIWYGQIIALSLFTVRRRVARSANSGYGPGARHDRVQGHCNGTRYVERQVSRRRYIEAEIVCCSSHGYRCRYSSRL